jgi:hypothetical protein
MLFNHEFFDVLVEVDAIVDDFELQCKTDTQTYSFVVSKDALECLELPLDKIYASEQIKRVEKYIEARPRGENEGYKEQIVELAVEYQIDSKYTAFIAVNERDEKLTDIPELQDTVLESPAGWDMMKAPDMSNIFSNSIHYCFRSNIRSNIHSNIIRHFFDEHSDACETHSDISQLNDVTGFFKMEEDMEKEKNLEKYENLIVRKSFADIAKNDANKDVCLAAVEKIIDQTVLADVAKNAKYGIVRIAAADKLTDKALVQEVYTDVAKNDSDCEVRELAVEKITDQSVLASIAENDADENVRLLAMELKIYVEKITPLISRL